MIASERSLRYFIDKEVKSGRLIRIKNNIYVKRTSNPFLAGSIVYNGYVGFSSALYLLGLKDEVEDVIFICVGKNQKRLGFLNKSFIPINMSKMFYGTEFNNDILISTLPKTIFDMFYRPRYANFYDMYRAINRKRLSNKEWSELIYYATKSNIATVRRIGYALEGHASRSFINKLKRISNKNGKTSSFLRPKGRFIKVWKIYDDIDIKRWKDAR